MGFYAVARLPPICEDRNEDIHDVIRQCSSIGGVRCELARLKGKNVRQQCLCDPPGLLV